MKSFKFVIFMLLPGLLGACGPSASQQEMKLVEGWVRAMPPGTNMTAAYGQLSNTGSAVIEIVGFASKGFEDVSLHTTVNDNGIVRMESVPGWTLEPKATLVLAPGGYHLMLTGPVRELEAGDEVVLVVLTRQGLEFRVTLPVEAR